MRGDDPAEKTGSEYV